MAKVVARASRAVDASPEQVLALLRDYREGRPRILTSNYTEYRVQEGGESAGTVIAYHFAAGGRERDHRMRIVEGSEGVLEERDELSSLVSTWKVTPSGAGSDVTLESSWDGAAGIGGFFERTFAPRTLGRIYGEVLGRLAAAVTGPPS